MKRYIGFLLCALSLSSCTFLGGIVEERLTFTLNFAFKNEYGELLSKDEVELIKNTISINEIQKYKDRRVQYYKSDLVLDYERHSPLCFYYYEGENEVGRYNASFLFDYRWLRNDEIYDIELVLSVMDETYVYEVNMVQGKDGNYRPECTLSDGNAIVNGHNVVEVIIHD